MKNQDLELTYATLTNQGERFINEDSIGVAYTNQRKWFVLCDGLGGHGNGDIASRLVVEEMQKGLKQGYSIEAGIVNAQQSLLEKQIAEHAESSMKTTLTCLEITQEARFGYVGDSRIYLFENGKYKLRSQDHSVPQMLVNRGEIKEKEIRHHEDRSRLLRVMGTPWSSPRYQVVDHIPIGRKTSFLLCSDGFWELIEEKMMGKLLKKATSPAEWLQQMETIILKNGAGTNMDNYSAIAVFLR